MQIEQEARPAAKDIDYDKIRQLRIELEQKTYEQYRDMRHDKLVEYQRGTNI